MSSEKPRPLSRNRPHCLPILLEPWPVIVVIAAAWLIAVDPRVHGRPDCTSGARIAVAGLASACSARRSFVWQRRAVRRGSRGAQSGLS